MKAVYPLEAVRALALHVQGLSSAPQATPGVEQIRVLVEQLGAVQIDTLHVVQRSHYLVLWSRLGNYAPADFDCLLSDPAQRALFEYWSHAACLLPLSVYRYYLPTMNEFRQVADNWTWRLLSQDGNPEQLLAQVRERICREGGLRSADFERSDQRISAWWNWKPAKAALEHLFNTGELMVSRRVNFQRVYDLSERVLPAWVDTRLPDEAEKDRFFVEQGVRALGACLPDQAGDYVNMRRTRARPVVQALIKEGLLQVVEAELSDGKPHELIVHRDHLPLLEGAAAGELAPRLTTFLSFFDSLFWARDRDQQLWNFHNTIEAYKPAPTRQWGYFCLSILHRGKLVGRFDPKLERAVGRLRLNALYLEAGIPLSDELVTETAAAMRDFMRFHKAHELVIERSEPVEFGDRLLKAL